MNKVMLIGNLGQDAELKYTQNTNPVLNLRLACTETWKDKDGQKRERTEWIDAVVWGRRAEGLHPHLTRGKQIHVEGSYRTREWEDKNGNKRRSTEVHVGLNDKIEFLGGGQGPQRQQGQSGQNQQQQSTGSFGDDDIPF